LVEVERVRPEPPQTGLALAADRVGLETVADPATLVPDHAALGEDVRALAHPFEGAGDHFLRMAQAIDGGGVDPVDAVVQRFADRRDGVTVVLAAPGELPAAAADGPGPETDRGNHEVRISQAFGDHVVISLKGLSACTQASGYR